MMSCFKRCKKFDFLYCSVTVCREMRKSKTKDAPIFKDPDERVKWQSAMLLYIDDKSEKAGKSDEDICFEETTM